MKKMILKVTIPLLALTLAGCNTNNQKDTKTSSSVKTEKKQQSSTKKAKNSSSKNASASASSNVSSSQPATSSSSAASSSSTTPSQPTTEPRIVTLNSALNRTLGHVLLPQKDGLGQGSDKLNARYTGNSANFTVYYSVGNSAKPLNDPSLQNETPYATLTKKTYGSAAQAQAAINYHPASDQQGLPSVDLGHNIQGYVDSGAGQRYLYWNEGKWSLAVHAAAVNGEDPTATAKSIVELLEKYYLPAPNTLAAGEFEVSGQKKLTWQDGNTTYTLAGPSAETIIAMAASMR
ncbi:lipoprotein [Ligilactobacillus salitolerans]|uniref:Lipoprotein n=1 Tax=Ligilactobacillus salitolerans TaxID=1808352 RepID=A0A401IQD5_9LACO|nr:hypothetical protein [Ligilactobacillus salitolerans]GBG93748.1 lipoprotein [Ligilactobacillus salitolerans]